MQSRAKWVFFRFFTEETVFVTKLNGIISLRPYQERERFLLLPGTIEPSLVTI